MGLFLVKSVLKLQQWQTVSRLSLMTRTSQQSESFSTKAGLQIRMHIGKLFSIFLIKNICRRYSKEPSQHMFKAMGKKIIKILLK